MTGFSLPHHHNEENMVSGIKKYVSNVGNFQTIAEIFKHLGDTTRIRIFWLLCHCEECVINLSAMLEMSSPGSLSSSAAASRQRSDRQPQRRKRGLLSCRRYGGKPSSAQYD